jgi:type IV pilus assembly protein PilC
MTTYSFEALDPAGELVRGVETASGELELDRLLSDRGLLLVEQRVRARAASSGRKAGLRPLIDFCQHLTITVESGISLLEGLRDLADDDHSPIADAVQALATRVESGSSLSVAMESEPEIFPALLVNAIAAGEESGRLDVVLASLAEYLEWREDLGRKVKGALTYPAIVVVAMLGLVALVTTVVLPGFLDVFVELGVELPIATRILLAIHEFFQAYGLAVLAAGIVAVVGLAFSLRTERGRQLFDRSALRIPVVGNVWLMIEMSRLAHNLGMLYSAGTPVIRALELIEGILQNRTLRGVLNRARGLVERGEGLATALALDGLLPPLVMRMIALGETSGELDRSLGHVARYYDREVPVAIDRSIAIVNTAVIVVLGIMLATVALGVFLPIYQMMGQLDA